MAEQMFNCRDVEERLAPFVDGAERPDAIRAIQAHLNRCPPCREHAAEERVARSLIVESRNMLRGHAPERLRARCACQVPVPSSQSPVASLQSRVATRRTWVPLSLAASLLLGVAIVFGLGLNDRAQAFASGLALDHLKCFKIGDSVHPVEASSVERAWEENRGWPLRVARTDPGEQLELVSVRRCLSIHGLAAHVMYRWRGQPLSVYVLPRAVEDRNTVDAMGHETAIWSAGGRTYAVMANGHPDGFDHIVTYVKEHTR
jgi:anti-sigma factor RsiW